MDIKKKDYEAAVPRLNEIIAIYDSVAPGMLPGQYKKLAQKDLEKVPAEKLAKINADLKARSDAANAAQKESTNQQADDSSEADFEMDEND